MTSSNGNIFRVTGHLRGESTGHRWIPLTKASDAELWWFLWCAPEQTVEQNNRNACDLRRHHGDYYVTVMWTTVDKNAWHYQSSLGHSALLLRGEITQAISLWKCAHNFPVMIYNFMDSRHIFISIRLDNLSGTGFSYDKIYQRATTVSIFLGTYRNPFY